MTIAAGLAPYEIAASLGAGGMREVYRARVHNATVDEGRQFSLN